MFCIDTNIFSLNDDSTFSLLIFKQMIQWFFFYVELLKFKIVRIVPEILKYVYCIKGNYYS